jgi:hypothetical protein
MMKTSLDAAAGRREDVHYIATSMPRRMREKCSSLADSSGSSSARPLSAAFYAPDVLVYRKIDPKGVYIYIRAQLCMPPRRHSNTHNNRIADIFVFPRDRRKKKEERERERNHEIKIWTKSQMEERRREYGSFFKREREEDDVGGMMEGMTRHNSGLSTAVNNE